MWIKNIKKKIKNDVTRPIWASKIITYRDFHKFLNFEYIKISSDGYRTLVMGIGTLMFRKPIKYIKYMEKTSKGASGRSLYDNTSDCVIAGDEATAKRGYLEWLEWRK